MNATDPALMQYIAAQQAVTQPAKRPDYGDRLRLGMILPNRNIVAENDAQAILPAGVSIHTTRLKLHGTTAEDILGMSAGAESAAKLLGPAPIDLIVFHCTAVSTHDPLMGDTLVKRIEDASGKPAMATSQALVAAFKTLQAKRIVMLTPYEQAVNDAEVRFCAHYGVEVLHEVGLQLPANVSTASVSEQEWFDRAIAMKNPDADAYFLSCTNIKCISVIAALEHVLEAPVITSNQAMLWHALRQCKILDKISGYGELLQYY